MTCAEALQHPFLAADEEDKEVEGKDAVQKEKE
jgi:hypothetical protein